MLWRTKVLRYYKIKISLNPSFLKRDFKFLPFTNVEVGTIKLHSNKERTFFLREQTIFPCRNGFQPRFDRDLKVPPIGESLGLTDPLTIADVFQRRNATRELKVPPIECIKHIHR